MTYRNGENPWSRATVERLIVLWENGKHTKKQIAHELKTTREAVVGKIGRMRRKGHVFRHRSGSPFARWAA